MEDIVLAPLMAWMQAHPQASARIVGLVMLLLTVGNLCKVAEHKLPPELLKKRPRIKTALRIGQTVGNVVWGLVALVRAFVENVDPDELEEAKGDSTT